MEDSGWKNQFCEMSAFVGRFHGRAAELLDSNVPQPPAQTNPSTMNILNALARMKFMITKPLMFLACAKA